MKKKCQNEMRAAERKEKQVNNIRGGGRHMGGKVMVRTMDMEIYRDVTVAR